MVPLFRCSSMNLCTSAISSCVSGRSLPGSDFGTSGSSSIAWSHTVCCGSRWDFCSSNSFLCLLYSSGNPLSGSFVCFGWMVTLPMKCRSRCIGFGMFFVRGAKMAFFVFFVRGAKMAFFVLSARKTIGSWVWSIHPCFQSIFGWFAANHGYPNMALCSPR